MWFRFRRLTWRRKVHAALPAQCSIVSLSCALVVLLLELILQSCGMGETAMQAKSRLYLRCILPPGMQDEVLYLPARQDGGMRLVQPSLPWTVVQYRMLCTNGNTTVTRDFSRQSIDLVLEPGLWTITVEGLSASGALIVTATKEIELLPGRTSSTTLQL
ncbi:MAG: hypothetical protein QHH01_08080, partial [Spirochaetales bacterium]|nr:hypothetical protein [Spirochaetales bacterium]